MAISSGRRALVQSKLGLCAAAGRQLTQANPHTATVHNRTRIRIPRRSQDVKDSTLKFFPFRPASCNRILLRPRDVNHAATYRSFLYLFMSNLGKIACGWVSVLVDRVARLLQMLHERVSTKSAFSDASGRALTFAAQPDRLESTLCCPSRSARYGRRTPESGCGRNGQGAP